MRRTDDPVVLRGWLADRLRPGDHVVWSQAAAEPLPVLAALLDVRATLHGGALVTSVGAAETVSAAVVDHLAIRGLGGLGTHRALSSAGLMDVVPTHLSQLPGAIRRGDVRVDVALVQVSRPDGRGRHSLGLDASCTHAAMERARVVVAEVNARMPWTDGHVPVPTSAFDLVLETDRPLPSRPSGVASEAERAAAAHAAPHVPEGATLQFGIGSAPGALAAALADRRGLRLHTGLLDDAQFALVGAGAVADHPVVTGTMAGSAQLYVDAAAHGVRVCDAEHTHGTAALAGVPRFTAVNTAVEVDVTGQVNAEVAGDRYVGGVGGLADFVRGSLVSEGGRSIFLLTSTAGGGRYSRIVPQLAAGTTTVARSDVDVVATEFGAVELRGRSLGERIALLASIAHPDHRDRLLAVRPPGVASPRLRDDPLPAGGAKAPQ